MAKKEDYIYSFEKLIVWQQAIDFVSDLYGIVNLFPNTETFGLTSQIKRAGVSIPANIAECTSRKSFKEQSRFTEIVYGSLLEVLNHLIIANKLNYISNEQLTELRIKISDLSRQLNALNKSQLTRESRQSHG